jgi:hypothetical protein
VAVGCALGDDQLVGDFAIRQAGLDQFGDLVFPFGM